MKHGEAYVHRRSNLDFTHDIDKILRQLERLPKRMNRDDAMTYYKAKLRKVFGITEYKRCAYDGFDKPEHYFHYWEAKRMVA